MFTGFAQKLPEYEVITPHTNLSFRLKSMTVQEEERLKGSLLTPSVVTDHLNRCIYDCVVVFPESIKNYEDFISKVTLKDRDALLYGLYHVTYEEVRNYDVSCGTCGKTYPITIKASSTFSMNSYPGNDILTKTFDVNLPVLTNVFVTLRQPTLKDEQEVMKIAGSNSKLLDILTETLVIKAIVENVEKGDSKVYSSREDIVDAFRAMPPADKKQIFKSYKEQLGAYGIELKMRSTCAHCGQEDTLDLDLVDNFFRMVHSIE